MLEEMDLDAILLRHSNVVVIDAIARLFKTSPDQYATELERGCFACMLRGQDGATLFMLAASCPSTSWGPNAERTAQVITIRGSPVIRADDAPQSA